MRSIILFYLKHVCYQKLSNKNNTESIMKSLHMGHMSTWYAICQNSKLRDTPCIFIYMNILYIAFIICILFIKIIRILLELFCLFKFLKKQQIPIYHLTQLKL